MSGIDTDDELAAFREAQDDERAVAAAGQHRIDTLVFEIDGVAYAVPAGDVTAVINWRQPAPVPKSRARIAGVVQDGGRIIVVLAHPAGQPARPSEAVARFVVCHTSQGLVALPAAVTHGVEAATSKRSREPATCSLSPTLRARAVTFVSPEKFVEIVWSAAAVPDRMAAGRRCPP